MKFKKLKDRDDGVRGISVADKDGDILEVQTRWDGKPGLYFCTNDSIGVHLTKSKALKVALAILDELHPL